MDRPVDPYALPRRAVSLLADAKQREAEIQGVLASGIDFASPRPTGSEILDDVCMDAEHSAICQALRYLTLCTGGPVRRRYPDHAYAAKHRAEALTINDITGYYVSENTMIASVLMCGGQMLKKMDTAWVGIRQPGRCTHCKRIMSHSRKIVCCTCHRDGRPLPINGVSGRNTWVSSGLEMHHARAYTPTKFPPDTDVLGPLPT